MLTLEERLVVVNLYEDLGSYRAVAELTGCDHKTVKAWVERQRENQDRKRGTVLLQTPARLLTDVPLTSLCGEFSCR
jgi:transposase